MEGFLPRPEYPEQISWIDPTTGESTKFALSGNPNTGEGWIDGIQLPAETGELLCLVDHSV